MAQNFPTKPLTLIVPFAAGGPSDVIARLLGRPWAARWASRSWSRTSPGRAAAGAKRLASRRMPDGCTLLIRHLALAACAPSLYANLGYDTLTGLRAGRPASIPGLMVRRRRKLACTCRSTARRFFPFAKAAGRQADHRPCRRRLELRISAPSLMSPGARREVTRGRLSRHRPA